MNSSKPLSEKPAISPITAKMKSHVGHFCWRSKDLAFGMVVKFHTQKASQGFLAIYTIALMGKRDAIKPTYPTQLLELTGDMDYRGINLGHPFFKEWETCHPWKGSTQCLEAQIRFLRKRYHLSEPIQAVDHLSRLLSPEKQLNTQKGNES